jgi:hypothetical protein
MSQLSYAILISSQCYSQRHPCLDFSPAFGNKNWREIPNYISRHLLTHHPSTSINLSASSRTTIHLPHPHRSRLPTSTHTPYQPLPPCLSEATRKLTLCYPLWPAVTDPRQRQAALLAIQAKASRRNQVNRSQRKASRTLFSSRD